MLLIRKSSSSAEPPVTEPLATEPSLPWRFVLRLHRILAIDGTPESLMVDLLAALQAMPEIAEAWVAVPDAAGRLTMMITASEPSLSPLPPCPHVERAMRTGVPQYVDDWLTDRASPAVRECALLRGWRSGMALALPSGGKVPWVLIAQSSAPAFFSKVWPPPVLEPLSAMLAGALETRRAQSALRRAQTLYKALFDGAEMLLQARDETHVLGKICRLLVDSGLFASATIGQLDKRGIWRHRNVAARHGAAALRRAAWRHRAADESQKPLNLLTWLARETLICNDYARDPRFSTLQDIAGLIGMKSVAGMIIRRRGARWAVLGVTASEANFFDGEIIGLLERLAGIVGHLLDEIDLKKALRSEREAQSLIARQDRMTGLPNRLGFEERVDVAICRARQNGTSLVIGKIDLDDFKRIDDRWGRPGGDAVLRTIANRLRAALPDTVTIGRLGGDEFDLLMEQADGAVGLPALCATINEAVSAPITLPDGSLLSLRHCAGFTLYPDDDADAEVLMRHAYMALCAAKAAKGRAPSWRLYEQVAEAKPVTHGRALLERGALRVYFQPVQDLVSGQLVTVEALARLEEAGEIIPPAKFLADLAVEDRGVLFRQVLHTALKQVRIWDQEGIHLNVSVNVDAQTLLLDDTLPYLRETIASAGLMPYRLILEILETHDFLDLRLAKTQIEAARALGLRVALDDLGAGYSSMMKIRELPIDVVKLDRSFVAGLRERPDDLTFVAALQAMATGLGIKLVVEGVETDEVLDALRIIGARYAQGYAIARPMSGAALTKILRKHRPEEKGHVPTTLLGAYADHLNWLRAIQMVQGRSAAQALLRSDCSYGLREYFATHHFHGTPIGDAYHSLRTVLQRDAPDRDVVLDAAESFRGMLKSALRAHS
jgi:diguanylate cyclase (GGDEF)-like protein